MRLLSSATLLLLGADYLDSSVDHTLRARRDQAGSDQVPTAVGRSGETPQIGAPPECRASKTVHTTWAPFRRSKARRSKARRSKARRSKAVAHQLNKIELDIQFL